jgi:hypothetical protein
MKNFNVLVMGAALAGALSFSAHAETYSMGAASRKSWWRKPKNNIGLHPMPYLPHIFR